MNKPFENVLTRIKKFRDDRNWKQFHNPKDMAEAIVIEASELLEHFLWKKSREVETYIKISKNKEEIADEIADVLAYTLELADNLKLDIDRIIRNKYKKNAKKYPVKKSMGTATKYTKL